VITIASSCPCCFVEDQPEEAIKFLGKTPLSHQQLACRSWALAAAHCAPPWIGVVGLAALEGLLGVQLSLLSLLCVQ
jgi:hypothetical protein